MSSQLRNRLWNDHNVYVLGAGFSAAAGVPVVKGFMNEMRDCYDWIEKQPDRDNERMALEAVLKFRLEAAGASYRTSIDVENVEELFSLASAVDPERLATQMQWAIGATIDFSLSRSERAARRLQLSHDRDRFVAPKAWRFPTLGSEGKYDRLGASAHELMIGTMVGEFSCRQPASRNTIISFNYDLLPEQALTQLGVPFSYGIESHCKLESTPESLLLATDAGVSLLKLHGSVNWAQHASLTIYPDYERLRRSERSPVLVPPTWHKVFTQKFANIWTSAVRALSEATNVVIIGFSAPRTDLHFRYLMSAGLRENISLRRVHVVNPDGGPETRARYFGVFREEMLTRGVLAFHQSNASTFLFENSELIGRKLAPGMTFGTCSQ